jgi:hypothetical protein
VQPTLQLDIVPSQEFAAVTRRKTGGLSGYGFALLSECGELVSSLAHCAVQQEQQQKQQWLKLTFGIRTQRQSQLASTSPAPTLWLPAHVA